MLALQSPSRQMLQRAASLCQSDRQTLIEFKTFGGQPSLPANLNSVSNLFLVYSVVGGTLIIITLAQ